MRKVWKRGRRSRRGGREEEEEDKKSGGKGERKKKKRGENEGRRAKASRGNRPLRLFSGRRKPPLLVFYHIPWHNYKILIDIKNILKFIKLD